MPEKIINIGRKLESWNLFNNQRTMANRPVFIPSDDLNNPVLVENIEFEWYAGMAISQKQRSIQSLHENTKETLKLNLILEVSSKSEVELGRNLSAFKLQINLDDGSSMPIENAFQGSKVFKNGGPFTELYFADTIKIKKDIRLKESGDLTKFTFEGFDWPIEPKTVFYDWLYLKALVQSVGLTERLLEYDALTDIEFNPKKSFSCQAKTVALYVHLQKNKILDVVNASPDEFIKYSLKNKNNESSQLDLFK
jgi:type I restriction enzyme M protein